MDKVYEENSKVREKGKDYLGEQNIHILREQKNYLDMPGNAKYYNICLIDVDCEKG